MSSFNLEITIDAPRELVWEALADLEDVARWSPDVKAARYTSTRREGVGASRHCDLRPFGHVEETVRQWTPFERIDISIDGGTVPTTSARGSFLLQDQGKGTLVTVHFEYVPKGGPVGRVLDRLGLGRKLRSTLRGTVTGLKEATEAQARASLSG